MRIYFTQYLLWHCWSLCVVSLAWASDLQYNAKKLRRTGNHTQYTFNCPLRSVLIPSLTACPLQ